MSRKPKKGYFVRGQFVAEGSELDAAFKAELKGTSEASKTELKRASTELQKLGADLLTLPDLQRLRLGLPEKLHDALQAAHRISDFEGRRRQMQYIGKLMRQLPEPALAAVRAALDAQHLGSAQARLALHEAERWRERLIASDEALTQWLARWPSSDAQQLRALVRQARKDQPAQDAHALAQGLAPRHGRAFRELFQHIKEQLGNADVGNADVGNADASVNNAPLQDASTLAHHTP